MTHGSVPRVMHMVIKKAQIALYLAPFKNDIIAMVCECRSLEYTPTAGGKEREKKRIVSDTARVN